MKKFLCVLLAALLLCPLLCACGDGGSKGGEYRVKDASLQSDFVCDDNNRVFYEIFVGSFSDSDGDGTGDLRGIINRMDYLNDGDPNSGLSLGVEGIWLTPVFRSPSYHKYDITDYYAIDPAFGTLDDLRELCDLCEARNVKLILDLPLNHTGALNSWFGEFKLAHRKGDTASPYYDFYTWVPSRSAIPAGRTFRQIDGSDHWYECNFSGDMPELNFDNPAVREEVLNIAKFYLDLGVDGFRFDAAKYVYYGEHGDSVDFWVWYCDELRALQSDIYMVAEVWDGDGITDRYFTALNCFNFTVSQTEGMLAKAAGGDVDMLTNYTQSYLERVQSLRADATIVPFIANHDTDRAAGYLPVTNGRAQMAANVLLLGPGSPFIYYGEEVGAKGTRGGSNTDANRRLAMLWGDGDTISDPPGADYPEKNRQSVTVTEQLADQNSLYNYYKTVIMVRHANPEIARGTYTALDLPSTKAGGFISVWNGSAVCVLHNTTASELTVDVSSLGGYEFSVLAASVGLGQAKLENGTLTIGAQTSVVLRQG